MSEKGFTLIELMASLLIFSVVALGLGSSFSQHMTMNHIGEVRSMAAQAAQQVLDGIRYEDPATLPESGTGPVVDVTIGNKTFSVTPYYCEAPEYCATQNVRHITVRVQYRNVQQYEVQTVFTQLR